MMKKIKIGCLLGIQILLLSGLNAAEKNRTEFNDGWKFERFGKLPAGAYREEPDASIIDFNDSDWRSLSLPHDYGIEGPAEINLRGNTGKMPWAGVGWYRKHFSVDAADQGQRIFLDFDAAMSRSKVYLNGQLVGGQHYGYFAFRVDLTDALNYGGENVLAVRLFNDYDDARWYPGAGLYRNVYLVKTAPLHVAQYGVFVTTPEVSDASATINVKTAVTNQSDHTQAFIVEHQIVSKESPAAVVAKMTSAKQTLAAGEILDVEGATTIDSPTRWDLENPHLYHVITKVKIGENVVDEYTTDFGIRTIEFIADKGFFLNGERVQIKGVCMHHDLGPLGAAVNYRAIERQVEILQEMGSNAIRTSHNPPAPELIEICNRLGVMIVNEAFDYWVEPKGKNDYGGDNFRKYYEELLRNFVRRDRNAPSVIMWSVGNEVKEQGYADRAVPLVRNMTKVVKEEDPTRPSTIGCNNQWAGFNGVQKEVGVFGYNYKAKEEAKYYIKFMEKNPEIPLYGSETASAISSRDQYFFPVSDDKGEGIANLQVSDYVLSAVPWGYIPDVEFAVLDRFPAISGEFVWTGFDYLGEPTPFNQDKTNLLNFHTKAEREAFNQKMAALGNKTPSRSSYFGIIDLCGFPKNRYYIYQAHWRPDYPMVHVLPHWTWPGREGEITPVHVFTSGDEAELFLNGKSLGRKKKGEYEYRLRWDDVIYQPGELSVVAYKDGKKWAETSKQTVGEPAAVQLEADRSILKADGRDLAFVTVSLADAQGRYVPSTQNRFDLSIEGSGEIIAVGNGDSTNLESFQSLNYPLFNGLALVVVKTDASHAGDIVLKVESDGLKSASITLKSEKQ
ncbi:MULTISPECIES: beta-galactosidase GalB [unclassified Lentimonas]|uniref:beta-galactosidase GalB n=2 Tax=Lentimonas TaxID=417293 RepID=UPI001FD51752|nr:MULTISPECIES: beta-galactosidase GalB [unclassified Lentimonas]